MSRVSPTVLQMPELIHNIARFMPKGDLARIATVSKVFCRSTTPWIWETVFGAAPLLRLLPCVESKERRRAKFGTYSGTFTFSKPLTQADLGRLNYYAQFVKHFYLFSRAKDAKLVAGWEVLLEYVHAGSILLPNLITLGLKSPGGLYCEIPPYLWAVVFCSPRLKSVSIDNLLAPVSPRVASALLGFLADACPDLVELEVHLASDTKITEQDKYIASEMDTVDHVPKFLGSTTLRNLVINSFFANRYHAEISQAPCLQRLEIHPSHWHEKIPISFPAGSFPALRELKFQDMRVWAVEPFWQIRSLVAGLTTLECQFYPNGGTSEGSEAAFGFPLRFSTTLRNSSPHITDLRLNFDSKYIDTGDFIVTLEADVLRTLAQLPLRKISVDNAKIDQRTDNSPSVCELLASTFSSLEVLRWPCAEAKYEELSVFTTMPNLQHLAIGLSTERLRRDFSNVLFEIPLHRDQPFCVPEADICTSSRSNSRADWFRVARYLVDMWPDIQLIPQSRGKTWTDYSELRLSDDQYRILNKFIQGQRGLGDEQAAELWESISEEWFAARFPEQPSWWRDEEE